ncbi:MAG TPA: PaaR repeat-containing protein [Flavobacteriales bacterium]|nr:PaaR repeat-containing protein [Flavobacteriales bacterium]
MGISVTISAICTGHPPFPPRGSVGPGVPTVLIGGKPAMVVGDTFLPHCAPMLGCHPGSVIKGSLTVLIGGKPAARVGDQISCGSTIMGPGVPTVLIGG